MATLPPVTLLEMNAWSLLHTNELFGVLKRFIGAQNCLGPHVYFCCLRIRPSSPSGWLMYVTKQENWGYEQNEVRNMKLKVLHLETHRITYSDTSRSRTHARRCSLAPYCFLCCLLHHHSHKITHACSHPLTCVCASNDSPSCVQSHYQKPWWCEGLCTRLIKPPHSLRGSACVCFGVCDDAHVSVTLFVCVYSCAS